MKIRFPLVFCCVLALLMAVAYLQADSPTLGFAGRRATTVENQRVEKQMWAQPQTNAMSKKSFPLKEWDKHFSSVGSKRAPITLRENKEKQMFRTETIERKEFDAGMSRWNGRMADLHQKAGIQMDDRAQLVADKQLYSAMLQDTQQFRDMADEVSLRDINRYQFRRNHSDGELPVQKVGAGQ